jgi:steroid 5-alpha reductase family enzyme
MLVHFGKRCVETLFVHVYSKDGGAQNLLGVIMISGAYCMWCYMTSKTACDTNLFTERTPRAKDFIGIALFASGTITNFMHHRLLARLRKSKKANADKYLIPKGGMFNHTTCPHYFGELMAWLGVAVVLQEVNGYLVFLSMFVYLTCRAFSVTRWYRKKFDDYPKRSHIIPFLF